MCGIVGFCGLKNLNSPESIGRKMMLTLRHRGPDSEGFWFDASRQIFFGHRRLAIQDISETGHQPMHSPSSRYVISYNGELYNNQSLRTDLEQALGTIEWLGTSDTETLLAAIDYWGFPAALQRINGMFAFALYDKQSGSLSFARDRLGEKPLYYGYNNGSIFFGSELKALSQHPLCPDQIDRDSIGDFLRYSCVPAPYTIFKDVWKLQAGHYLTIIPGAQSAPQQQKYWDICNVAQTGLSLNQNLSDDEWIERVSTQLDKTVASRMVSDVPLGTFLSGGLDSSIVTALLQKNSANPVQSFSIGFSETAYNEAPYAKAVAKHLGTEHTELYVSSADALAVVPQLGGLWDEPFSDSSQIPTYLVSKLARGSVTVALSGDGGDEIFGGYSRYQNAIAHWEKLDRMPAFARRMAGRLVGGLASNLIPLTNRLGERKFISGLKRQCERADTLAELFGNASHDSLYRHLISHSKNPSNLVKGGSDRNYDLMCNEVVQDMSFLSKMMLHDFHMYLPETILTKVDRASMAVRLEARAPLLDHELVELAWELPEHMKLRAGQGKWILRQVLGSHIPSQLIDRPKMGFGVPLAEWLRGPLRDWAEQLLSESLLERQGYLQAAPIRKMWNEHQRSVWDWHYYLWDVLMFQSWLLEHKADEFN